MTRPSPPSAVLDSVNKSFGDGRDALEVLDGISLVVGSGEFVSIVGPSGCGKSTLLSVLAGIEPADSGSVLVDGLAPDASDGRFAWMPQADVLFPWRTVRGNVALGAEVAAGLSRDAAGEAADRLLAEFDLSGFASAHPDRLSGGMRQRASLARTVAQGRGGLLLDEPFGALDALTRTGLQLWLEEVRSLNGWTVVLVTHDVREAVLLSDRVIVLSQRSARVTLDLAIPLPRPRTLETLADPVVGELERELLRALDVGSA